jgi:ribose-phosphate pyrophosphokinase
VTSRSYAALLSSAFDALVTADPHLHRYRALDEIYRIPTRVVHTAPLIASWVAATVQRPLLIGPDSESEQWVSEVAAGAGAPWTVLRKIRRGDSQNAPRPDRLINHANGSLRQPAPISQPAISSSPISVVS